MFETIETGLQEWSGVARLLMKKTVFRKLDGEDRWASLEKNINDVARWFAFTGFEVIIDRTDGYAYLRSADLEEGSKLPCITSRHQIKGKAALLAVMLRRELYSHAVSISASEWPILTRSELHGLLKALEEQAKDQVGFSNDTDNAISILTKLQVLHSLSKSEKDTSVDKDDKFEITPLIKAVVDVSAMHAMLRSIGVEEPEPDDVGVTETHPDTEGSAEDVSDAVNEEPKAKRRKRTSEPKPVQGNLFDDGAIKTGTGADDGIKDDGIKDVGIKDNGIKDEVVVSEEEIDMNDEEWEEDDD